MSFKPTPIKEEVKSGQMRKEHPYVPRFDKQIDGLPSAGKPYPKGLHVKYRPYVLGEITAISGSKMSIRDVVEEILSGVECSHGFSPMDLTLQDVLFIGFLRKRATFSRQDTIIVPYFCSGCENETQFEMKENQDLSFRDILAPSLPISYTMYEEKFSFSPVTCNQYFDYLTKSAEMDDFNPNVGMLAIQCTSHSFEDAYQAIKNATPADSDVLNEIDKQMNHELEPVVLTCKNLLKENEEDIGKPCGHKSTVKLDEVDRLVLPFRGESDSPLSASLQFG
jgi:hypothetical protein